MTKLTGIITSESKLEGNLGVRNEINVSIIGTGPRGRQGSDGYTPIKGIDYFDGIDGATGDKGEKGTDGVDGYTPQKGVDYFDGKDGKDGQNGVDGKDGKDGYTPIKGIDYFDGEKGAPGEDGSDATVTNSNITDALGYTPANATNEHTHANKSTIDKFSEVDNKPYYNGEEIGGAVPNLTLNELILGGRFKIVYNDIEDSLDIEVI